MSGIAITKPIKYVFLDVVGYTRDRSVEAQTDIIGVMNTLVGSAIESCALTSDQTILIPTGDGICIAIVDPATVFDIHLVLALEILKAIEHHNQSTDDVMRKFQVRTGINENVDNLVIDINGNKNLAGAGINFCQRIMSCADGGQILVGQVVFETLKHRERYMKAFRRYEARLKHGFMLPVFQYIGEGHAGVSISVPSAFTTKQPKSHILTQFEGYFLAHALKNRNLFFSRRDVPGLKYVSGVLLWFLASDSTTLANSSGLEAPSLRVYGKGARPIAECLDFYSNIEFWVIADFASFVSKKLEPIEDLFEVGDYGSRIYFAVSEKGRHKLRADHPEIWKEFGFDAP